MDTLTHALIGSALCSRTGLAGGKRGPFKKNSEIPRVFDWTAGVAFFFGLFPDIASLGLYLTYSVLTTGTMGWRSIPPYIFTLYNLTHSLIIAALIILAVSLLSRPLAITMLAWPVHIVTDMFTHGSGRFATPIFYPLSDYRFSGVNWWENPYLSRLPLLIMTLAWMFIICYRLYNVFKYRAAHSTEHGI